MCFVGKNSCSRLTKKKACIQFEDKYEDLTVEKHSKNLKCTVKVKRNTVKVTQQGQRIFKEFKEYQLKDQNEGINQREGYKQSSSLNGKISNNRASTT